MIKMKLLREKQPRADKRGLCLSTNDPFASQLNENATMKATLKNNQPPLLKIPRLTTHLFTTCLPTRSMKITELR